MSNTKLPGVFALKELKILVGKDNEETNRAAMAMSNNITKYQAQYVIKEGRDLKNVLLITECLFPNFN